MAFKCKTENLCVVGLTSPNF
jgi:hypothetical protein